MNRSIRQISPFVNFEATFHIARFEYRLHSVGYPLRLTSDPSYGPFLGAVSSPGRIYPVQIETRVGAPRIEPRWRLVFEAGEVWRLFASGDRRMIARYADNPPKTLCTACLDEAAGSVDITCSKRMLVHTREGLFLQNPAQYPLDQLFLIHALGPRGILCHAAGAAWGSRGVLLAGISGAGKTTISRLLHAQGDFRMLSDDRIVVTRDEGGFSLHGTPWPGEGGFARDEAAPLAACIVLRKGDANACRQLTASQGFQALLPTISIFWPEPELARQALAICQALTAGVPVYEFFFTPDDRAPKALANLLGP